MTPDDFADIMDALVYASIKEKEFNQIIWALTQKVKVYKE